MATTKRIQKGTAAQLKKQGAPMAVPMKPKAPVMPKVKAGKGKC